jgi:hypothetical protein
MAQATKAIMKGEYGTDPDEALSVILACQLARMGYLDLLAFIGNHAHALQRAQAAKYVLNRLGLPHIPVGMGEEGFGATSQEFEADALFLAPATQLHHGRPLLRWTLEHSDDNSVVFVENSGFTDTVWAFMDNPRLFLRKVRRVVIMGGLEMDGNDPKFSNEGFLIPSLGRNGAANNCFDPGATLHMYDFLQRRNVETLTTTRFMAYGAMIPFDIYRQLAATRNMVGIRLDDHQRSAIDQLWKRANADEGTAERGDLPVRCDRAWFVGRFCGGVDPGIGPMGDIVPFIREVALYDPMNLMAACDGLREKHFDVGYVDVRGVRQGFIGRSERLHGVRNPHFTRSFVVDNMVRALEYDSIPIQT